MPTTGAVGGSTIDVRGLVSQLVAAERGPTQNIINNKEQLTSLRLSALGALKGALSGFQSALEPLRTSGLYDSRSAVSADTDFFTASATASAATGVYDIEVLERASAHQLRSNPYAGGASATVGTGTLTIATGENSFSVEIDADNNSLSGIAAAINGASTNTGVQATLITGVDGTRLVLTARSTGASSAITVTQTGGDGGLAAIAYDPPTTTNLTQAQAARDARISISGIEATSETNVFADAIEGVTITAKKQAENPGETLALTVSRNTSAVTESVKKFISAYNAMYGEMAKQRAFDPATRTAAPMFGDAMLRSIESQVRNALNNPIAGAAGDFTTLASIGVKTTASGTLQLDEAKFNAAVAADPSVVSRLFGGENGVAERMHALMKSKLADGAEISSRNSTLDNTLKQLDKDKEALDVRMAALQARYLKQFSALDTLLSGLQQTSAYLSQQLANLPGAAK